MYLVFGVLTTAVNYFSYIILRIFLTEDYHVLFCNATAWFLSVLFAFITNKLFVFESKTWETKTLAREASSFFGARIFSGVLDLGIMYVFVSLMSYNELIIKLLSNVVVVIINYILSKLFIFKKKK